MITQERLDNLAEVSAHNCMVKRAGLGETLNSLYQVFNRNPVSGGAISGAVIGGLGGLGNAMLQEKENYLQDIVTGAGLGALTGGGVGVAKHIWNKSRDAAAQEDKLLNQSHTWAGVPAGIQSGINSMGALAYPASFAGVIATHKLSEKHKENSRAKYRELVDRIGGRQAQIDGLDERPVRSSEGQIAKHKTEVSRLEADLKKLRDAKPDHTLQPLLDSAKRRRQQATKFQNMIDNITATGSSGKLRQADIPQLNVVIQKLLARAAKDEARVRAGHNTLPNGTRDAAISKLEQEIKNLVDKGPDTLNQSESGRAQLKTQLHHSNTYDKQELQQFLNEKHRWFGKLYQGDANGNLPRGRLNSLLRVMLPYNTRLLGRLGVGAGYAASLYPTLSQLLSSDK